MSGNYSVNVPKLKGRENYDDWAFAVENFLILEGVDLSSQQVLNEESDRKARAKMILTVDPSLYVHIKGEATVRNTWNKLKSLFDDSGYTRKISLLRNLISIRLETCESMIVYVTQLVETAQKLKGTGFEISDEWIGSLLLAGLPEKFSPMIMAIEHSGMSLSADAIKTKLLDMSADFEVKSESAFIAKNSQRQNGGSNKKFQRNRGCGNETQTQPSVSGSVKSSKIIRCYRCKQVGHFKNQCPEERKGKMNAFSAVFFNRKFNQDDFYIDSGSSTHLISDPNLLSNVKHYEPKTKQIIVANQQTVDVVCSGDLQITTVVGNKQYEVVVNNVLCIPNLTTNLLSVSRIIASGNRVVFNKQGCFVYNSDNDCIGEAKLENEVYRLNIVKSQQLIAASVTPSSQTWHRRLGHINSTDLSKMKNGAVEGLSYPDKSGNLDKSSCTVCCEGKQSRLPFPLSASRSKDVLELVHSDLCGPMENMSLGNARYYLIFVDDYSRMCFVYFLQSKHQTFKYFKEFQKMVENQQSKKIKLLRSDSGGEYCSIEMENYLKECGIVHQRTTAYTPESNGLSERFNRSIVEKARCLLFDAHLEKRFWAEAVNTAVYVKNRSPTAGLSGNTTPYEMWTGRKPNVGHLRIFGSPVMVHVPKQKRRKWDKKATKMLLVGYSDVTKGYRLFNPVSQDIVVGRDVVFMENAEDNVATIMTEDKQQPESVTVTGQQTSENNQSSGSSPDQSVEEQVYNANDETYVPSETASEDDSFYETDNAGEATPGPQEPQEPQALAKRVRHPPDYYGFSGMGVEDETAEHMSLAEAVSGPERAQWHIAMMEELQSFEDNGTWELVDRPKDGTVVKNKWLFKKKFNSEGEVRYRARLVAKGFTQKKGIDFTETFSPVLRYSTLRLLFALSVQLDLNMNHLDVPTAFLNGFLEENVYIEIPEHSKFVNSNNKVLKLKRAIYGLKQSARAWYTRVEECLLELGYQKSKNEPCLFIKNENNVRVYIALFVDDFFVFYNCRRTYELLKTALVNKFKIKDLGQIKQCLGMRVNIQKDCITVDQEQFVEKILKRFDMSDCHGSDTPMEVNLKLEKGLSNSDKKYPYQQLLGSLMYLSVLTRADIAYSVSYLSQYNNSHNGSHWKHLKRLLKYLQKTKSYGLVYRKDNCCLHGFVDADWASCTVDRRSYTGYCFIMSGSVISFESRKQRTIALSSCESEYMALSEACKEAIYLQNLLRDIMKPSDSTPICLYSDSQSSIKLAANPLYHKRTKHIDVRHHFVRDCVYHNKVKLDYVSTSNMPADLLTKSLGAEKHYKFLRSMGILEV
jgi:hypothetical protein